MPVLARKLLLNCVIVWIVTCFNNLAADFGQEMFRDARVS